MRALLSPVSLFALALWSLLCWGASGLVGMTALGRPAEAGLLAAPLSAETWLAHSA